MNLTSLFVFILPIFHVISYKVLKSFKYHKIIICVNSINEEKNNVSIIFNHLYTNKK